MLWPERSAVVVLLVNNCCCTKTVIWQSEHVALGTHVVMAVATVKSEESSVMQTKSDDGAR